MFLPVDLRFMRVLRLTRLLRVLKLNRYSRAMTMIGIGLIALPTAIISSGFLEQLRGQDTRVCPHCGKPISGQHDK